VSAVIFTNQENIRYPNPFSAMMISLRRTCPKHCETPRPYQRNRDKRERALQSRPYPRVGLAGLNPARNREYRARDAYVCILGGETQDDNGAREPFAPRGAKRRPLSSRYLGRCRRYMSVSSVIKCDYMALPAAAAPTRGRFPCRLQVKGYSMLGAGEGLAGEGWRQRRRCGTEPPLPDRYVIYCHIRY
jgi:hypothetical protein